MSWRILVEPDGARWVNPLWRLELVKSERKALENEVGRLRGLIAATTETHEYCPWCGRYKAAMRHAPACHAFTPEGEVK